MKSAGAGTQRETQTRDKSNILNRIHIGSVSFNDGFEGDQYVFGIVPKTIISGKGTGNVRTWGLIGATSTVKKDSSISGDIGVYSGFVSLNTVEDNSSVDKMTCYSIIGAGNYLEKNAKANEMKSGGSICALNNLEKLAESGDTTSVGIIMAVNELGTGARIKGFEKAKALIGKNVTGTSIGGRTNYSLDYAKERLDIVQRDGE